MPGDDRASYLNGVEFGPNFTMQYHRGSYVLPFFIPLRQEAISHH
jgi:hypothetical protein